MAPLPGDKDDDTFSFTGPALGEDGKLDAPSPAAARVGRIEHATPPPPPPAAPAPLELVERPPHAETDFVAPPPPAKVRVPGRGPGVWLLLLALAGAGVGGYTLWERTHARPRPTAVVLITSEPSGATVRIDGTAVGTTPWAADNVWGSGAVKVEVSLPGFRTWTGSFAGGTGARLQVNLQKR